MLFNHFKSTRVNFIGSKRVHNLKNDEKYAAQPPIILHSI